MKKSILYFVIFAVFAGYATADRSTYDATKTRVAMPLSTPPVIDGAINIDGTESWAYAAGAAAGGDSYWTMGWSDTAKDFFGGGIVTSGQGPVYDGDIGMRIWVGYDSNFLYVAVRVQDDVICEDTAAANSQNGNTWEDDSVEVFVDGDNSNFDTRDTTGTNAEVVGTGGQYVITVNNAYREAEAGNPGYGASKAWYAQTTVTDTGYDAEFQISLKTLGSPKLGDIIGFTIAVNDDDDDGTLENQYTWIGSTHVEASYGNLLLGPKTYTAPKTAAPAVDGKISPGEYGTAKKIEINTNTGVYDMIDEGENELWPLGDHDYSGYVVHDANAVYVAIEVIDDIIMTDTAAAGSEDESTWEDDSAEIFFDADASDDRGRGTGQFEGQYVLTPTGAHRDAEANNPTFGETGDWYAASTATATGYQIEFKILKLALFDPADGTTMGFDIAVNDDDTGSRKTQLGWNGYPHNESSYGNLVLAAGGTDVEEWALY